MAIAQNSYHFADDIFTCNFLFEDIGILNFSDFYSQIYKWQWGVGGALDRPDMTQKYTYITVA